MATNYAAFYGWSNDSEGEALRATALAQILLYTEPRELTGELVPTELQGNTMPCQPAGVQTGTYDAWGSTYKAITMAWVLPNDDYFTQEQVAALNEAVSLPCEDADGTAAVNVPLCS